MGDAPRLSVSSQPLVVSSTTRRDIEEVAPVEQSLRSDNGGDGDKFYSPPLGSQNVKGIEADPQSQQHYYSLHSPRSSHRHIQNILPEGPHSIAPDNLHIHTMREMTDSDPLYTAHPQLRYSSTGFAPPMTTHGYQAQPALSSAVAPLASTVYYPYPNPRYTPIYYSPFIPSYGPQNSIPVAQLAPPQGTFIYTHGYPPPYPQTSSLATPPPNAPRRQPQLHSLPPRWLPGQHPVPQYLCMANTLVPQAGPQPMQTSFSHPAPSIQQPSQQSSTAPGFRNIRRHSHPPRVTPVRARAGDSELLQLPPAGWGQVSQSYEQPGGTSTSPTTTINPLVNIHNPATAQNTTSMQLNPFPYAPSGGGSASMQAVETPGSSLLTTAITSTHPALPRGPPRKPRQSGHALWVGNLPPGTNIVELKDHFSREATREIESVFLISKSNCAFINYKTDTACNEAMTRFHANRFKGVNLVCRLRRNSAAPTSPSGGTANSDKQAAAEETGSQGVQDEGEVKTGTMADDVKGSSTKTEAVDGVEGKVEDSRQKHKDRIFILKSLTVEDLDLSVKNGVWATQSHNEEVLNRAFETSENVYLIFSANKSGEYHGYARMTSRIPEKDVDEVDGRTSSDTTAIVQRVSTGSGLPEALLPKAIHTPATATAPEGRIIDDSARGTIFWEVMEEELAENDAAGRENSDRPEEPDELMGGTKSWGKPFNVQWISTTKLPFYRTRGLRNSWNSNREVKIARDGTEVEETVGKRLLQMFHRLATGSIPLN